MKGNDSGFFEWSERRPIDTSAWAPTRTMEVDVRRMPGIDLPPGYQLAAKAPFDVPDEVVLTWFDAVRDF
jgi:hypothetical protein